jgi:hypothetical protein
MSLKRYNRRKEAKGNIAQILSDPKSVYFIHYSCESFYDREGKGAPRITTIAVRHMSSAQTKSFSIYKCAQIKRVSDSEIDGRYDELEKEMLQEFYRFLDKHQHYRFVHWNMRDENYGFPAIEMRFKVLGGYGAIEIHEEQLYDLSRILIGLYGSTYIGHPRLQKLMDLNHISDKDFLTGQKEADAFEEKKYHKLHQSTLRKVDNLENILERVVNGTFKHRAKLKETYGGFFQGALIAFTEHPVYTVLSIAGLLIGIGSGIYAIFK